MTPCSTSQYCLNSALMPLFSAHAILMAFWLTLNVPLLSFCRALNASCRWTMTIYAQPRGGIILMESIWPNSSNRLATSCCWVLLSSWPTHRVVLHTLRVSFLRGGSPFCRRSRSRSRSLLSCERERGEWCRLSLDHERDLLCRVRLDRELDRERLLFGDLEPERERDVLLSGHCLRSFIEGESIPMETSC